MAEVSVDSIASDVPSNNFQQRYFYHQLEDEEVWYCNGMCYVHNARTDQIQSYACPQIPHQFMYELNDKVLVYAPQLYNAVNFRHMVYALIFNKLCLLQKQTVTELCVVPDLDPSKSDFKIAISDQRLLACNGKQLFEYNTNLNSLQPLNIICSNVYTFCDRTIYLKDGYYFLNSDLSSKRISSDVNGTLVCCDSGLLIRQQGQEYCLIDFTTLDFVKIPRGQLTGAFSSLQQSNYHQFCEYNAKGRSPRSDLLVALFGARYEDFDNRREQFSRQHWMENHVTSGTGLQRVLDLIQQVQQSQLNQSSKLDRQFQENSQRIGQLEQLLKSSSSSSEIQETVQLLQFSQQQKFQQLQSQLDQFLRDVKKEVRGAGGASEIQEQLNEFSVSITQIVKYQEGQMDWLSKVIQQTQEDYASRFQLQDRNINVLKEQVGEMESRLGKQFQFQQQTFSNFEKKQSEIGEAMGYMGMLSRDLTKADSLVNKINALEEHITQSFDIQEQKLSVKQHMEQVKVQLGNLNQKLEESMTTFNQLKSSIKIDVQGMLQSQSESIAQLVSQIKPEILSQSATGIFNIQDQFKQYLTQFGEFKDNVIKAQEEAKKNFTESNEQHKMIIDGVQKPDNLLNALIPKLQESLNDASKESNVLFRETVVKTTESLTKEMKEIKDCISPDAIGLLIQKEMSTFRNSLVNDVTEKVNTLNQTVMNQANNQKTQLQTLNQELQTTIFELNKQFASFTAVQNTIPDKLATHLEKMVNSSLKQNQEFQEEIQRALSKFGDTLGMQFGEKLTEFKLQVAGFIEKHARNYDEIVENLIQPINKNLLSVVESLNTQLNKSLQMIQEALSNQSFEIVKQVQDKVASLFGEIQTQIQQQVQNMQLATERNILSFNQEISSIKEEFQHQLQKSGQEAIGWKQQLEVTIQDFTSESRGFVGQLRQETTNQQQNYIEQVQKFFGQQQQQLSSQLDSIEQFVLQFSTNSDGFVAQFRNDISQVFDENIKTMNGLQSTVVANQTSFEQAWDQNLQLLGRFGILINDSLSQILPQQIQKMQTILQQFRGGQLADQVLQAMQQQNIVFLQHLQQMVAGKV